jgi:hypothetical protein
MDLYSRIVIRGHYVYERSSIDSLFLKQLLNDTTERTKFSFILLVFSLKTAGSKRLNTKVCLAEDNDLDVLHEQSVRFEFPLEHLNVVPVLFQTNFTMSTWMIIIVVLLIMLLIVADALQDVIRRPPVAQQVGPPQVLRESRASG